jgi:3-isopropylmalate/(R)-2-methylmalate dehydratase large subunit
MFIGATTAIFAPDDITFEYYQNQFSKEVNLPVSDSDCNFEKIIEYDLSNLEPQLVKPPRPQDTLPLRDFIGTRVQQGYIGSCASGRLEDLAIAAQILKGRKIADGFRLFVVPSSAEIMAKAANLGYLEKLIEAGAWISSPTCDFCYGKTQVLADGEVAISTGTLNVSGRMGNVNSEIYIGSAASVAAAAVLGSIDDPRNFLKER